MMWFSAAVNASSTVKQDEAHSALSPATGGSFHDLTDASQTLMEGSPPMAPTEPYSLLAVRVPAESEVAPFLAALPDTALPRYRVILPRHSKILVLDLDETLVHSTAQSAKDCDFMVEVLINRSSCLYYVSKRPHVDHFLDQVSSWYHLVIYTASLKEYADPVISWLDRGRRVFRKRLFRSACVERDGVYLKDLTLVDSDLARVALVDNSPASFLVHPDNAIPIEGWINDRKDTGLLDLLPFLDALRFVEDVRSILSLRRM